MNQRQRGILIVCAALIAMMLIYPPFQIMGRGRGYSWIFLPPNDVAMINASQLLVQWIAVILIGGILFLLANGSKTRVDSDLSAVARVASSELPKLSELDEAIALPIAGPWRRFFARFIDLWVITLPVTFGVALLLGATVHGFVLWIQRPGAEYVFSWLLLPLVLVLEAGSFALFGNTIGKVLLGIKVVTIDAQSLTAVQYLKRQVGVYLYGLGTGFPLAPIFTMWRQHWRLKAAKYATYDDGRFCVKASKLSLLSYAVVTVVLLGLLFVNGVLVQLARIPITAVINEVTYIPESQVLGRDHKTPFDQFDQATTPSAKEFTGDLDPAPRPRDSSAVVPPAPGR
jgi:uncharacterized RDD family membrane protein YckC